MNDSTNGFPRYPDETPERVRARERSEKARAACTAVFGNDPPLGAWSLRPTTEFGRWATPCEIASESEEGLARVLARLEELAPTATPRWRPVLKVQRRRRL